MNFLEFSDYGEYWRSWYEEKDLKALCERTWNAVKPLYQQLHAYVRRRLMKHHANNLEDFPPSRHIPAHLLGRQKTE